jgi:hypothetical protein
MTDTLHDLLHEAVADADMPDFADAAWRAGGRARRRRTVSAVAGVAATVAAVGGVVWAIGARDAPRAAQPVQSPPTAASIPPPVGFGHPDGEFQGTSVWWAPTVAQESSLPAYPDSPLPPTIDLSAPATLLVSSPIPRALAAFAVEGDSGPSDVLVLGEDGALRSVSLASVSPMHDPEGNVRTRAGSSMLSPSGRYLMFPQDGSIRLLRLATDHWSTIDVGAYPTWDATWADGSGDRIVLWDSTRPDAAAPVYDVSGARVKSSSRWTNFLNPRWDGVPYGLPRRAPNQSLAQSYTAGLDVPQPPALHLSPRQSDAIGIASAPDAMLVLPQEPARQKQCCQVAGWMHNFGVLVFESRSSQGLRLLAWQQGTGDFWRVSDVVGWTMGKESVETSYARLWSARG